MNDDTETTPIDLSALDPTRDPTRFNDVVGSIARDAMASSGSRLRSTALVGRDDAFDRLARWWPATLAAATVIIAVSIRELTPSKTPQTPVSAMDVLGIPHGLTNVLQSRELPSLSDLTAALTIQGQ